MACSTSKRNIPPFLRTVLDFDADVTSRFCLAVNRFMPLRSLKIHYKMLEISCHGIPWLGGWLAFIWLMNSSSLYQMQVNFYLGLIIDIILVAVIKAAVRRRRPLSNVPDMFASYGPDVYAFPSGHASRAAFIVYFFIVLFPLPIYCFPPMLAWSTSVCLSRLLLQRHNLLDVVAGICLGMLEGCFISIIWLNYDTSEYLLSSLTDAKAAGGDYHV